MTAIDRSEPQPLPGSFDPQTIVIATVSLAHAISHFAHLIIPPMFPLLREAMHLSNTELGFLMTVFFVVSCAGQAAAGFLVDRVGAVPVLIGALATIASGAAVLAIGGGYPVLIAGAALIGAGNAPFHPVDYSILNARIGSARLGSAYAFHGVAGSLGWALAPVFMVGLAGLGDWRIAFAGAAGLTLAVMLVVIVARGHLQGPVLGAAARPSPSASSAATGESAFAFLRLPSVWLSFVFFFVWAVALGGVQTFGTEAARALHQVPLEMAAVCLTAYMIANACGTLIGGRLLKDPAQADRIVGVGFLAAAVFSLVLALAPLSGVLVPVVFAAIGLGTGACGPSRDMLIRAAAPPGATGRVYGVVYSGLDIGMAFAPLVFGAMMDRSWPAGVWLGIALTQALLIVSVLRLGRSVRSRAAPAAVAG